MAEDVDRRGYILPTRTSMAEDVDRRGSADSAPRRACRQGSADPAPRSLKEDLAVVLPIVVRVAIRENASKVILAGKTIVIVLGDKRKAKLLWTTPSRPRLRRRPTRRTPEAARPRQRQDVRCSRSVGAKVALTPSKLPMNSRERRSHLRRLAYVDKKEKEKREEVCPPAPRCTGGSCVQERKFPSPALALYVSCCAWSHSSRVFFLIPSDARPPGSCAQGGRRGLGALGT